MIGHHEARHIPSVEEERLRHPSTPAVSEAALAGSKVLPRTIEELWASLPYVTDPKTRVMLGINRPTAGGRSSQSLPVGSAPIQLYTLGTPNGIKAQIMLEELRLAGVEGADYDAHLIEIWNGDQFTADFLSVNPNGKIPCLTHNEVRVFETGSILVYLAETFASPLLPSVGDPARVEVMNWLMWALSGQGPMTGQFGHFFKYAPRADAPDAVRYGASRYGMEALRHLDVLDLELAHKRFVAGEEYSIADIAVWPWVAALLDGTAYDGASRFLGLDDDARFPNLRRWFAEVKRRPAVRIGRDKT